MEQRLSSLAAKFRSLRASLHAKLETPKFLAELILALFVMGVIFVGCGSDATRATTQLKNDADSFQVVRRITAVNLYTHQVLCEVEGRISYTVESDGDLSLTIQTGEETYLRDVVGIGQAGVGIVYIVEQIEPFDDMPYYYDLSIYAEYPDVRSRD